MKPKISLAWSTYLELQETTMYGSVVVNDTFKQHEKPRLQRSDLGSKILPSKTLSDLDLGMVIEECDNRDNALGSCGVNRHKCKAFQIEFIDVPYWHTDQGCMCRSPVQHAVSYACFCHPQARSGRCYQAECHGRRLCNSIEPQGHTACAPQSGHWRWYCKGTLLYQASQFQTLVNLDTPPLWVITAEFNIQEAKLQSNLHSANALHIFSSLLRYCWASFSLAQNLNSRILQQCLAITDTRYSLQHSALMANILH